MIKGKKINSRWAGHAGIDLAIGLQDAHSIGFTANTDQHLIGVGYQVCSAMATGNTASDIAEIIFLNTDWTVTLQDAALFTLTAITDLCPQQGVNAARHGQALL